METPISGDYHCHDEAYPSACQALALDAARRAGPAGHVLATDISAAILEFAAANAQQAGLNNIETRMADAESLNMPSAKAYLDFIRCSASPIIRILSALNEPAKDAAWDEMEERLETFQTPTGWKGPNELLLTVGSK